MVPNPGHHDSPEYLMNMVLRAKKQRKLTPRFTHWFIPRSWGSSIPASIDATGHAPRFAASRVPPPPVMTA